MFQFSLQFVETNTFVTSMKGLSEVVFLTDLSLNSCTNHSSYLLMLLSKSRFFFVKIQARCDMQHEFDTNFLWSALGTKSTRWSVVKENPPWQHGRRQSAIVIHRWRSCSNMMSCDKNSQYDAKGGCVPVLLAFYDCSTCPLAAKHLFLSLLLLNHAF